MLKLLLHACIHPLIILIIKGGFIWFIITYLTLISIYRLIIKIPKLIFNSFFTKNLTNNHTQKQNHENRRDHINPMRNVSKEVFMKQVDVIRLQGYDVKQYEFMTKDGAYVSFWRILPQGYKQKIQDKNENSMEQQKLRLGEPVILMHGLLDHSYSWFINTDKRRSLPYMLAKEGFDVWVGNNRGTRASLRKSDHVSNQQYWSYTFDHLLMYDFPTLIQSVLKQTGYQQLYYVGHSQGGCQLLTSTGIHPQLQPKIKKFIGLGTLIGISNLTSHEVVNFLIGTRFLALLKYIGFKSLYVIPNWMSIPIGILMHNSQLFLQLGQQVIVFLCGYPQKPKIDMHNFPIVTTHAPGGGSINNIEHLIQCVEKRRMARFDYGVTQNLQIYGAPEPPPYNYSHLGELPFHSYLFQGDKDKMITQKDFRILVHALHQEKVEVYMVHDYGHLDYMWAKDADKDIYERVVEIVKRKGN